MIVIYENELCTLEMDYDLFECMQRDCPDAEVEIFPLTSSTYKRQIICCIGDLEDYSRARNLLALGMKKPIKVN